MTGSDAVPTKPTAGARSAVRSIARRVRGSRLAGPLFARLLAPCRTPRSRRRRWGAAADRLLQFDVADSTVRRAGTGLLVELFFDIVAAWEIERFVEAGAKDAGASQRAAQLESILGVVAFEANPFTYRRFERALAGTNVTYEHLALSSEPGEVTFYVRLTDDGRPSADGQGSLHARSDHRPGHRAVTVPAVSLDSYFDGRHPTRTAVWIDVEGALDTVLTGATRILMETDVVMAEVEERPYWASEQWLRADVDDHLAAFGLVPIARDQQSRYQYNVVYVRASRLDEPGLRAAFARWATATRRSSSRRRPTRP